MEQHQGLRQVLRRMLDDTASCLRGDAPEPAELATSVRQLISQFRGHLAWEERHLFPVLERVDDWGRERVQDLSIEHQRQRSELDTLLEGLDGDWELRLVAVTMRSLAADLLIDMAEEERGCLSAELLSDEVLFVGVTRE